MIGAHQLTIVAGLTYRQVDHWTRAGYLTTVGNPTPGSGASRAYDDDQVALAVQLARLTKAGIPMPQAHPIALDLLEHGHAELDGYVLVPIATADLLGEPLPDTVTPINKSGDNAA